MRLSRLLAAFLLPCALLAPAAAEDPPAPLASKGSVLVMPVPGTGLDAKLDLAGFVTNTRTLEEMRRTHGDRVIAAGSAPGGVVMSIVVTKDGGERLTSAAWRKKEHGDKDEIALFDAGDVACFNATVESPTGGTQQADYHAYAVAAGHCFHVRAGQLGDPGDDSYFSRRKFRELIESFRVGSFRRGTFSDHPPEVVDLLHRVAAKFPDWKAEADAAVAAANATAAASAGKAPDWVPAFVAAEAARAFGAPDADRNAAWTRAAEALGKAEPTELKARFAWASAEEAAGLAEHGAGKYKAAVVRLTKAASVAPPEVQPLVGAVRYSLARAQAKAGVTKDALASLKLAIAADPSLRAAAPKEADFAILRNQTEFKALTSAPK